MGYLVRGRKPKRMLLVLQLLLPPTHDRVTALLGQARGSRGNVACSSASPLTGNTCLYVPHRHYPMYEHGWTIRRRVDFEGLVATHSHAYRRADAI